MLDKMEKQFEKTISSLSEKEQNTMRAIKNNIFVIYNGYLKPILIAFFMFWLFGKIKNIVGLQETVYVLLVVIVILLRALLSKLS